MIKLFTSLIKFYNFQDQKLAKNKIVSVLENTEESCSSSEDKSETKSILPAPTDTRK